MRGTVDVAIKVVGRMGIVAAPKMASRFKMSVISFIEFISTTMLTVVESWPAVSALWTITEKEGVTLRSRGFTSFTLPVI